MFRSSAPSADRAPSDAGGRARSGRLLDILMDGLKAGTRAAVLDLSGSHGTLAG